MFFDEVGKAPSEATRITHEFREPGLMESMILRLPVSNATVDYESGLPITTPKDGQQEILCPLISLRYSWLRTNEGNVGIENHANGP